MSSSSDTDSSPIDLNVADIPFLILKDAASAYFGGDYSDDVVCDLVLAEAVRLYVYGDGEPNGRLNSDRRFSLDSLLSTWGFSITRSKDESLETLVKRGDVSRANLIERGSRKYNSHELLVKVDPSWSSKKILSPKNKNGFCLTGQGIGSGLRLIAKFRELESGTTGNATPESRLQEAIDSTDWTGLAKRVSAEQAKEIRKRSADLLAAIVQSDADSQTKADALKRVEAVILLLEAPNVPWREVVSLLNNPAITAFFAAISIIQFILGIA